ncbi:MAG: hydroxymethylglutaryl-CoA lyase [Flavobacteriales bacterium]|jgi:hydroxymethylglutaryl-CoA lyase
MKIIECPRDAMQGIHEFIPTNVKIEYLNQLLKVGFDTLDFGSFVSPKAIPQLRDTAEVLSKLELNETNTKLLAIVGNTRGAIDACAHEEINFLGYPFSISEKFQMRNTNATIEESLTRVEEIQSLCLKNSKQLVLYISMAFGNPYDEPWHPDIAIQWCERLKRELDVQIIALSDTIGVSNPDNIKSIFEAVIEELPEVEFGAHLHTTPDTWEEKIAAAHGAGCRRFDGALKGYGGCPMAADDLTGNMPTELMLNWFERSEIKTGVHNEHLSDALNSALKIFS